MISQYLVAFNQDYRNEKCCNKEFVWICCFGLWVNPVFQKNQSSLFLWCTFLQHSMVTCKDSPWSGHMHLPPEERKGFQTHSLCKCHQSRTKNLWFNLILMWTVWSETPLVHTTQQWILAPVYSCYLCGLYDSSVIDNFEAHQFSCYNRTHMTHTWQSWEAQSC